MPRKKDPELTFHQHITDFLVREHLSKEALEGHFWPGNGHSKIYRNR
jgi:hypothetical protein